MKNLTKTVITIAAILLITSCGDPIGTPCAIKGSSFTASHNCQHRCLQHRTIVCPDGNELTPKSCSGKQQCEPGSCSAGQVCYHVNDPFNKESYCLEESICGALTADQLSDWEQASLLLSQQTRKVWEEKQKRMSNSPKTQVAEPSFVDE